MVLYTAFGSLASKDTMVFWAVWMPTTGQLKLIRKLKIFQGQSSNSLPSDGNESFKLLVNLMKNHMQKFHRPNTSSDVIINTWYAIVLYSWENPISKHSNILISKVFLSRISELTKYKQYMYTWKCTIREL